MKLRVKTLIQGYPLTFRRGHPLASYIVIHKFGMDIYRAKISEVLIWIFTVFEFVYPSVKFSLTDSRARGKIGRRK